MMTVGIGVVRWGGVDAGGHDRSDVGIGVVSWGDIDVDGGGTIRIFIVFCPSADCHHRLNYVFTCFATF